MYLNNETQRLIAALSASSALENCRIVSSFPYEKYPARLRRTVIAVSPDGLDYEAGDLDLSVYRGKYTLSADIYVPQELGSPVAGDTVKSVLDCVAGLNPQGIKVGSILQYDMLSAFCIKCSFTFFGGMRIEEEEDEGD